MTEQEDMDLARELGVRYAERCACGHVLVTSDRPITVPQVLPCCKNGECPYCASNGEDADAWDMADAEGDHNHDPSTLVASE
jgi:hypothetical protein